jgi:acetylornithine deacetylase/succinyl-diaminopimelate desuccinylase-like protein
MSAKQDSRDGRPGADAEAEAGNGMQDRQAEILAHIDSDREAALGRLFDLLRIGSVSTDPAFRAECRRAGQACVDMLAEIGFDARLHDTPGQPMVLGHYQPRDPVTDLHLLFYGHYDVQPADPLELWHSDPFEPRLAEQPGNGTVIVARGAADDKGQLMTFMEALRAVKRVTGDLPCRVSVLIEGEEECGSQSLAPFIAEHADELRADLAVVCDTNQWDRDTPAITTMLRGLVNVEMTICAASRDLHSGYYGGAARNPLQLLCAILGAARGEDGSVRLPGFYDGIVEPSAEQLAQWHGLGFDAAAFLGGIGLAEPAGERDRSVLEMVWSRPTMEINGIVGGYAGPGVKTVIPAEATAKLSFRLVPGQDPRRVLKSLIDFVEQRLPGDCRVRFAPSGGSPAIGFDTATPPFRIAAGALAAEFGRPALTMGCGASIPIVTSFARDLGMNTLLIGFGLDDDCIHSPNEKYNLSSFAHGTRAFARLILALCALRRADLPPPPQLPV